MRRTYHLVLVVLSLVALFMVGGPVLAQGGTLEYGQEVEGELTADALEATYTFNGTAGDIVLIEMRPPAGSFDLDPTIMLSDASGNVLAVNDDFSFPNAVILAELPDDGKYAVLAGRSGGETGTSIGPYVLRVSKVEPLTAGSSVEATIYSDFEKSSSSLFVLHPTENGPVEITFSQPISDLYGSLELREWLTDDAGTTIMSFDDSAKVTSATFNVELEGNRFYVLIVDKALLSFTFDDSEAVVTVTVN
jgi:hypothetical protein